MTQRRLDVLTEVLEAFNRHDLDAIMAHFARFEGIPDVHYGGGDHFVSGDRGLSEWTISGTTVEGERIEVRGCDLWTFGADDTVTRKDSFWKIREPCRRAWGFPNRSAWAAIRSP